MPKYSYETYSDMKSTTNNNSQRQRSKVGYFKLKPGEKAVVRFNYGSASELEIVTIHEVKVKDRLRTIVCLRSANEPLDNCPFCAGGLPLKARVFVKLLHYVQNADGSITAVPEVANFPKKYADILMARFNEYGDLRDSLFTITRIGAGVDTTYDISYANPVKYSEANGYVKDFSDFENLDLAHHSYSEKTKEEMEEYLQSGEFPMPKKATTGVGTSEVPNMNRIDTNPVPGTTYMNPTPTKTVTSPVPEEDDIPVQVSKPVEKTWENGYLMPDSTPTVQQPAPQVQPSKPAEDFTVNRPRRTYDI